MGITTLIQAEIARYKRRGLLWVLVSFAGLIGFQFATLGFGRWFWPKIIALHENKTYVWFFFNITFNNIFLLITVSIVEVIYFLQHPFFE
jgi:hypothetical protein